MTHKDHSERMSSWELVLGVPPLMSEKEVSPLGCEPYESEWTTTLYIKTMGSLTSGPHSIRYPVL
jgi:hypothetical protein